MQKIIYFIFAVISFLPARTQQPDLVFHHTTEKDGLSHNIVNCFFKDSRGMLWIGTYNGLSRYDGSHFYNFRKGKDRNTLPENTVHKLTEDKKGNIWGATDNGIFCYNQQKNSFRTYHTPGEKDWNGTYSILCDQQGTIWATNIYCLVKYNASADSFERVTSGKDKKEPDVDFSVRKNGMLESPDGKGLWLGTNLGLIYYDKGLQKFISNKNNQANLLFTDKSSSALCATNYGHYWYYDNVEKRLVGFDPNLKKVKYVIQPKEFESKNSIATVYEDNNHLLWISTWEYNVYTIDYLHGNKITHIHHDKNNLSSIAGDFFWDVMQESDGTIWLGTVGGISKCNPNHTFYKIHTFSDSLFESSNYSIQIIAENKHDSTWWFTTNKKMLIHYNHLTGKTFRHPFNRMLPNIKGQSPLQANRLLFYKNNVLLFTNQGAWIKEDNKTFKPFVLPTIADTIALIDGALVSDSLLYCSSGKKLWCYHLLSKKVTELKFKNDIKLDKDEIVSIDFLTSSKDNNLWTINGTAWISYAKGEQLIPIKFSSKEVDLENGNFRSMISDQKGNLWIANKGAGLLYFNPSKKVFKQYKQYDGLTMDHIMTVSADSGGKIWTAAYNKFSIFNPTLNSFYNFDLPVSVNNYGYVNKSTTLTNGHIIFSIADKIVEFFPDRLSPYSVNTTPLISSLSVKGIEKIISKEANISLLADENNISLKFGLLKDIEASPFDMMYILEGAENDWTISGSNFEASYNNLSPGNYTFKVKAEAKDKSWQTKETLLKIHISTPFYKSWWFIFLSILAFVTAIYKFYQYRLDQQQQLMQLESKAQLLEKEKSAVMYENLKQQLNPHFLFNSLTSLAGLIQVDPKIASHFLEQLSGTYRYILKNGNTDTVYLKDEIEFAKKYVNLQQTRFNKGLVVNFNIGDEYLQYKIAPVTLQNLIENAIKHNIIDVDEPLIIEFFIEDDYLVVKNNLQKKNVVETSNKTGLDKFKSLYRYLSPHPIIVQETAAEFIIKIPLI